MAFRATPFNVPSPIPSNVLSIRNYKGLNVLNNMTEIDNEESPDLLNVIVNDYGRFETRNGYSRIYPTSLGVGAVHGLYNYIKADGTSIIIMAWKNYLCKVVDGSAPTFLPTPRGVDTDKVRFFTMRDYLWIQDGTSFYRYDGTTVVDVTSIAFIPTISTARAPDGSATNYNMDINLLQPKFTDSFSGTATDTIYNLTYDNLDAAAVVVVANNITRTEGVSFTVNRTAGTINFAAGSAPLGSPGQGTDNVQITAAKSYPAIGGNPSFFDLIQHCTINALYGGKNDTKAWLASTDSNYVNYSFNYDPSYWPENNFMRIGADSDFVMGFTLQYDTLIVHKRRTKWQISFTTDSEGLSMYVLKPINDTIGCIATDSIQLIQNNPVSLSELGVSMLQSSNVRDERNVVPISLKIDKLLLQEPNLQNAVSADFDNRYILVVNNNAYVFDYHLGAWFKWNNIPASCFLIVGDVLYFGSNTDGLVYKFLKYDRFGYLDDGADIESYWYSKVFNLGSDSQNKYVESVFYSLVATPRSNVQLYYRTEQVESDLVSEESLELFNYQNIDYSTWTYVIDRYPVVTRSKIKAKKIIYFQLLFKCAKSNAQMAISNIDIKFTVQNFIK